MISSVTVAQEAQVEPLEINDNEHEVVKRTTNWPSVLAVKTSLKYIAVTLEKYNGLVVYDINGKFIKKIDVKKPIWECQFVTDDEVLVVQADEENTVEIINVEGEKKQSLKWNYQDFFKGKPNS